MCTQKSMDDVLRQLQHFKDAQQMRRLLEEAIPCNECPEASAIKGEKDYDCSCREHSRTRMENMIRSIQIK